jgi:hypothetical protein
MASKYDLEVAVAPDRTAVLLTTLADGRETFGTRLEAPELDDLIRAPEPDRLRWKRFALPPKA